MDGKDISECLKSEEKFFKSSEYYGAMANRCGVPHLCRSLNEIIVKQIKKTLPLIRSKITSMLYQKEKELKTLQIS